MHKTANPKRRWVQYGLRSFLIVIGIFSIWLGWYVYRVERQKSAVQWVLENGGAVDYDFQLDPNGDPIEDQRPGTQWLTDALGIDFFATVVAVDLNGTPIDDIEQLAQLNDILYLDLFNTKVSDLKPLSKITTLKNLTLSNTPVTDITPLASLSRLERLELNRTGVVDLDSLDGLTVLSFLDISDTPATDLTPLNGLTYLDQLHIRSSPASKKEIEALRLVLPNCEIIYWPAKE